MIEERRPANETQQTPVGAERDNATRKTHCTVCCEEIKTDARKCIHCESYQNPFRRSVDFSTSVLALLVALFDVATPLVPTIFEIVQGENSSTALTPQVPYIKAIPVIASNNGQRPGWITGAELSFDNQVLLEFALYGEDRETSLAAVRINGNESLLIFLDPPDDLPISARSSDNCAVTSDIKIFDGSA